MSLIVNVFELIAMSLDTLPQSGRVLLLALLLSAALALVGKTIHKHPSNALQLLYRKGAAVVLVVMPATVAILAVQMPVYVEQARAFSTPIPGYITYVLLCLWIAGLLVQLLRLYRWRQATQAGFAGGEVATKLNQRAQHWGRRLGVDGQVEVVLQGAEQGWHHGHKIVLPLAAQHWPRGVSDAAMLLPLAQLQQRAGGWLWFSQIVQALYWPLPWVKTLFAPFALSLARASAALAASAYRDPPAWRRDLQQLGKRYETFAAVGDSEDKLLRLPGWVPGDSESGALLVRVPRLDRGMDEAVARKWQAAKVRHAQRYFDPYERVYWLIAVAAVLVGAGTTLTIEQASPEFEPRFLNIRWQEQMRPRLAEEQEQPNVNTNQREPD